jgi:hypothetical protein
VHENHEDCDCIPFLQVSNGEIYAPFAWSADAIVSRGPIDEPLLLNLNFTAALFGDQVHCDKLMEENAVSVVARECDVEPEAVTILNLTWSVLTADA